MSPLEYGMDELDTPWTEDKFISPEWVMDIISLDDAIGIVKLANVTDPDTAEVTLRYPVTPAFEAPQFVFKGGNTPTVYVDAFTGQVSLAN